MICLRRLEWSIVIIRKISCQRELKGKAWRLKFRSSSHDAGLRMRKLRTTAARISQCKMSCQGAIIINLALLIFLLHALAWNIPGHMLSGAIAYQILQRENPATITGILSVLEKNPWYASRWKIELDKLPEAEREEMLFMLAARWADNVRTQDPTER